MGGLDGHDRYLKAPQRRGQAVFVVALQVGQHFFADLPRQSQRSVHDGLRHNGVALGGKHVLEQFLRHRGEAVGLGEGGLEDRPHRGGELAAVHQDQRFGVFRGLQRGLDDRTAPQAVPDNDGRRQVQGAHNFGNVGAVTLDRAIRRGPRAGAVPAQIDRDGLEPGGQMRHLGVPVGMAAGEPVYEHDGRVGMAGDDVVNQGHGWGLHGGAAGSAAPGRSSIKTGMASIAKGSNPRGKVPHDAQAWMCG